MVVYLVGAGPGDIELITLKGMRLIQEAEVLIYDKLANPQMLNWVKPSCKVIYVGKREGVSQGSQETQKRINDLIKKYGKTKRVVRLKGGDCFIFGRGGEEAQICVKEGIKFEVIPGISSFYAVPAYSGIPITHRDFNSAFAVLTGHESIKAKSSINFKELPETIVILMGIKNIKSIVQKLIDAGRDPNTPVAAIYKGTTKDQKTQITSLQEIKEKGILFTPPVIFVVGKIVTLHHTLNWFENKIKNLESKKVVLLRAQGHEFDNLELMKSYGLEVDFMPMIKVVPRTFNMPNIHDFDALVFTSVEGIKQIEGKKYEISDFKGTIFAIGPKTKDYINKFYKIQPSIGKQFNSQGLADYILENMEKDSKILTIRSSAASDVLHNKLSVKFRVNELHVYDIEAIPLNNEKIRRIKEADAILVSSSSCAKGFQNIDQKILKNKKIVSIGPETSKNILIPHKTASVHTIQGMIEAYIDYLWV
ncbi:MAG: uroporphyrinogen-III C-methyltransferase [Promethearchaeota archaeon]